MWRSVRDVAAGRTPNGRGRPRAEWRDGSAETFGIDTLCMRATLRAARSEALKLPSVGPEAERRGGRVALLVLVTPALSEEMTAVMATVAATGAIILGAMYMPWNRA